MEMGKITNKTTTKITNQALAWVARLRSESVDETDFAHFADWLAGSECHQQAWDNAVDIWETLGVISHLPVESLLAAEPQLEPELNPQSEQGLDKKRSYLANLFSGFWKPLTTMAATTAIVVSLIMFMQEDRQHYYSAVGDYQQISLQDGSLIELNTDTEIAVSLGETSRDIELLKGEAFFTVASDKTKPFIVTVGDARVQALGTAFNIYRQSDKQSTVSVIEGVVRVSEASGSSTAAPESKMLLANDVVIVNALSGVSDLQIPNIEQVTAWRSGQIMFDSASVAEAVAILNRYLERKILVAENTVSKHRISGIFSSRQQDETLAAVAQAFDLALVLDEDNWLLSPSNP